MSRFDWSSLFVVSGLATLLRVPGIESRGRFDVDQGRDMLTLLAMTRDGVLPLLGPATWTGDIHHGAAYYYLLLPAAIVSGHDLVGTTAFVALLGILAASVTWSLGRSIGGPVAGLLAGLFVAVSPAAITASTFIWNPNPVPLFAAVALAAAFRAHSGGHWAWWSVALGAAGLVAQLHLLGAIFVVPIVVFCLLDLRARRSVGFGIVGGAVLIGVVSLPLLVHELQTGFVELRRVRDAVVAGTETSIDPELAIPLTLWRAVSSPFVGTITDAPVAAALVFAAVVGMTTWAIRRSAERTRVAVIWLAAMVTWSTLALALTIPSMQHITVGFPNDHFHAFLIPVVASLVAVPSADLLTRAIEKWRVSRRTLDGSVLVGVGLGVATLLVVSLSRMPPAIDPDGGWPAARSVGEQVVQAGDATAVLVVSLPPERSRDAVAWPIVEAGTSLATTAAEASMIVVVCDRLLEDLIGGACGGPAEDAAIAALPGSGFHLVDRFEAPRATAVSMYER
jgi:4-amino-4-deoxy-L-arabinose transferase-like glycosyltransferase